jgi:hypothetical protein
MFLVALLSAIAGWALSAGLMMADAKVFKGDGNNTMEFIVSISSMASVPVEIEYQTVDGTAKAGKDYLATKGKIILPAWQHQISIYVPILNAKKSSSIEKQFNLLITSKSVVLTPKAVGTIIDKDITSSTLQRGQK